MKKLLSILVLFTSLQVYAQLPPPSGDDGDNGGGGVVFYLICYNSDGQPIFHRNPHLSAEERAAICGHDENGEGGLIPFG